MQHQRMRDGAIEQFGGIFFQKTADLLILYSSVVQVSRDSKPGNDARRETATYSRPVDYFFGGGLRRQ
ncbi:MAG: hypothetical protein QF408_04615 [Pirellulales bacterium]|nr:hypothetical protein [Pirellulales bacterium]